MLLERAAKEEKIVREQEVHTDNHHYPLNQYQIITIVVHMY